MKSFDNFESTVTRIKGGSITSNKSKRKSKILADGAVVTPPLTYDSQFDEHKRDMEVFETLEFNDSDRTPIRDVNFAGTEYNIYYDPNFSPTPKQRKKSSSMLGMRMMSNATPRRKFQSVIVDHQKTAHLSLPPGHWKTTHMKGWLREHHLEEIFPELMNIGVTDGKSLLTLHTRTAEKMRKLETFRDSIKPHQFRMFTAALSDLLSEWTDEPNGFLSEQIDRGSLPSVSRSQNVFISTGNHGEMSVNMSIPESIKHQMMHPLHRSRDRDSNFTTGYTPNSRGPGWQSRAQSVTYVPGRYRKQSKYSEGFKTDNMSDVNLGVKIPLRMPVGSLPTHHFMHQCYFYCLISLFAILAVELDIPEIARCVFTFSFILLLTICLYCMQTLLAFQCEKYRSPSIDLKMERVKNIIQYLPCLLLASVACVGTNLDKAHDFVLVGASTLGALHFVHSQGRGGFARCCSKKYLFGQDVNENDGEAVDLPNQQQFSESMVVAPNSMSLDQDTEVVADPD